jgi:hypothetical protein
MLSQQILTLGVIVCPVTSQRRGLAVMVTVVGPAWSKRGMLKVEFLLDSVNTVRAKGVIGYEATPGIISSGEIVEGESSWLYSVLGRCGSIQS